VSLGVFSIILVLLTTPHLFYVSKKQQEMPMFSLEVFDYYRLTPSHIDIHASVESANHFEHRSEFSEARIRRMNKNKQKETVVSDYVIYQTDTVTFPNSMQFQRDDGTVFKAKKANYAMESNILSNNGTFELVHSSMCVRGKNLKVDRKEGTITAESIVATVDFE
jgi:lipopolysaccharide assembly outer membrane protein LptD (OstA)